MTIFYLPEQVAVNSAGVPLAFAQLFFYKAGTTTNQTVYNNADLAGGHAHAQPVVADATGTFPTIYLDFNASVDYRVQLKTALGALVYDQDNYPKSGASGITILSTLINYPQTPAELAASVTPTNLFYQPDPNIDPRRYNTNIGNATADLNSINTAITVLKGPGSRGGTIIVPANYAASMVLPTPTLSANQSIRIEDYRSDVNVSALFGTKLTLIIARDNSGGYQGQEIVKSLQNPGIGLYPVSDGTAPGFPIPNHMATFFTYTNTGANNIGILADPYGHGRIGTLAFEQYASGSVSPYEYVGVDANQKTRRDLNPGALTNSTINISSVTNTTPVVVNLASPHGIVATTSTGSIAGVTGALNTSWEFSVTGASQLTLLGSVASGAFGAVGTATVYPNSQRGTINVAKPQGGTESIVAEGFVVATTGFKASTGTNAKLNISAAMVAGTVTVNNTSVTGSSIIFLTRQPGGANPGAVYVSAQTASTSFVITSTNGADTGTVAYFIWEPA